MTSTTPTGQNPLSVDMPPPSGPSVSPIINETPSESIQSVRNVEESNHDVVDVTTDGEDDTCGATQSKTLTSSNKKKESDAWMHFDKIYKNGDPATNMVVQAKCHYCGRVLAALSRNGTSTLNNHVKICPRKKNKDIRQSFLNASKGVDGKTNVEVYNFDQGESREALAKMICMHEYPLSIVEHHGFRVFCNSLQPMFKPLPYKARWNSTYLMLQSAIPYKEVFSRLKLRETQYKCMPSEEDWELASDICTKLEVFYEATEMFSGTKYPTINLFFPKIVSIKIQMKEWELSTCEDIRKMGENMKTKFEKYWNIVHGVLALGSLLDPRYKMRGIEFMFRKLFQYDAPFEIEKVRKLAYEILSEYQEESNHNSYTNSGGCSSASSSHSHSNKKMRFESEIDMYISNMNTNDLAKCELDYYLEEACIPRVDDFDILAWWKSNGPKYPNLSRVAKDILAIPVSTVASESAFSTSGRFLSPHRSRLHPNTLEALMCAQDWLWVEVQGKCESTPMERGTIDDDCDVEEGTSCVTLL